MWLRLRRIDSSFAFFSSYRAYQHTQPRASSRLKKYRMAFAIGSSPRLAWTTEPRCEARCETTIQHVAHALIELLHEGLVISDHLTPSAKAARQTIDVWSGCDASTELRLFSSERQHTQPRKLAVEETPRLPSIVTTLGVDCTSQDVKPVARRR